MLRAPTHALRRAPAPGCPPRSQPASPAARRQPALLHRLLAILLAACLLLAAPGCGTAGAPASSPGDPDAPTASPGVDRSAGSALVVEGDSYPLVVHDCLGNETIIESRPARVAVISGTPLNIWYDLGGKSVCTSTVSTNVKLMPQYAEEIMSLPEVGPVYSVNQEAVIATQPDLIIAQFGAQNVQAAKLREMGYKVITTNIRTFDEVTASYLAFSQILGVASLGQSRVNEMVRQRDALIAKAPDAGTTVVILYLTASTLSVKLNNSIAGDVAMCLGLANIASNLPPDAIGSENTPLDIEYIIDKDPDFVLVASMIADNATAIQTMEDIFATNPIWQGVRAVREGQIVYLPQEYFLYNAGPYYVEAVEYMARGVYPQIYGELGPWYDSR